MGDFALGLLAVFASAYGVTLLGQGIGADRSHIVWGSGIVGAIVGNYVFG